MATSRALRALWIAVVVQLAGRLLDLRWHLTHDEFEGTSQQLEAHWLLWIGVLATVAVAAWTVARPERIGGHAGYVLTLAAGVFYVPVSVWHFIAHANGEDPGLAHVLLGLAMVGMVSGAVLAALLVRRVRRAPRNAVPTEGA
jgi:hypothetical protein